MPQQSDSGLGLPRYHATERQKKWVAGERRKAKFIESLWRAANSKQACEPAFLSLLVQCGWTNVGAKEKGRESTRRWRAGISRLLLHEMAHAAAKGNGHGKTWSNEIRRLIRLGAPLKKELAQYTHKEVVDQFQILEQFYDTGCEAEDSITWTQVRRRLGYEYGFVDIEGRVADQYSARFLEKARREWLRGRARQMRVRKLKELLATNTRL